MIDWPIVSVSLVSPFIKMEIIKTYRTRRSARGLGSSPNSSITSGDGTTQSQSTETSESTTSVGPPVTPALSASASTPATGPATQSTNTPTLTVTTRRSTGRNAGRFANSPATQSDDPPVVSVDESGTQQLSTGSGVGVRSSKRTRRGSSSSTSSSITATSNSILPVRRSERAAAAHVQATTKTEQESNAPPANRGSNQRSNTDEPSVLKGSNKNKTKSTTIDATNTSASQYSNNISQNDGNPNSGEDSKGKLVAQTNGSDTNSNLEETTVTSGKEHGSLGKPVTALNPALLEIEKGILAKNFKVSSKKQQEADAEQVGQEEEVPLPPIIFVEGTTGLPLGSYTGSSKVREGSSNNSEDGSGSSVHSLETGDDSPEQFTTLQLTVAFDGSIRLNPAGATDIPGRCFMDNLM